MPSTSYALVSTSDFDDDPLDGLSSEELEERAFGPDPDRKRARRTRRSRGKRSRRTPTVETDETPTAETLPVPVDPPTPSTVPAAVSTKFCYACGAELDARAEVCPHCGVGQPMGPFLPGGRRSRDGEKSKGGATLLALALGGVGAHRFYLGQPKIGLAMLLFSWTFLPMLVGVVDFVRLAFMSDREFAARYGRRSPMLNPPRPIRRLGPAASASDDAPLADDEDEAERG